MKPLLIALIAAVSVLFNLPIVLGQPAVKELERRVRDQAQRPDGAGSDEAADRTGYLGVVADDRASGGSGVELLEVMSGGPADKGGLEQGDIVTKVGEESIRDLDDFAAALRDQPVGQKLRFGIERRGAMKQIEATLGPRPPAGSRRFPNFGRIGEDSVEPPRMSLLGVRVEPLDPQAADAMKLPVGRGAYVVRVSEGSPAAAAGIPLHAVIVAVDGQAVGDPADLKRIIAAARPGQEVKVDYYSRGKLIERRVQLAELMPETPLALPDEAAANLTDAQRIERLELRVRALEARLAEFERFLGGIGARPNAD